MDYDRQYRSYSRREYDKDVEQVPDFLKIFWSHPDYNEHLERREKPKEMKEEEYLKTDPQKNDQFKGHHPFDKIEDFFQTWSEKDFEKNKEQDRGRWSTPSYLRISPLEN